jgi:molybdate transport system regulatory protein
MKGSRTSAERRPPKRNVDPLASVHLRIHLGPEVALGPGKADLLEGIAATGSIAAAGRQLGMSYKRAWVLIDTMNACFRTPLVIVAKGGRAGGGATLTPLGERVLSAYRRLQRRAALSVRADVAQLRRHLLRAPRRATG